VLDKVANIITLLIKEALHVCLTDSDTLMNRDEDITISNCWTVTLGHAQPMMRVASSSKDDDILDHDEDMKWKQKWKKAKAEAETQD